MKILVVEYWSAKVLTLECESTDTIAHLKAKLDRIAGYLMFDGKLLGDNLSENMTLADVGIQDGSLTLIKSKPDALREPPESSPRRPDLADADVYDGSLIELHERLRRRLEKEICIRCPSDSNLSPISSSTSIGKENGYLWSTMKILVMNETAKVFSLECESTDTIVHLKAKLRKITGISIRGRILRFDDKRLDYQFEENMTLADVGVQDGSLILLCFPPPQTLVSQAGIFEMSRGRPEKDYLYYANVFQSGWREEHAIALLHLLLELCQDDTISDGNVTDEAWLRIQNSLKKSIKCTFQIDFLKERLRDYKELYSVLAKTSSWIFNWDRERKTITINSEEGRVANWRVQYPALLLLRGPHILYFDTLEKVCLFLNTGQSSEQRVSDIPRRRFWQVSKKLKFLAY